MVVYLSGEVDLHSSPSAREVILDCMKKKMPLLVDLSGVSYMDSSGVASLVEGYQAARKQSLDVALVQVAKSEMTRQKPA